MATINQVLMTLSLKFEAGLKELEADLSEIPDLKEQISFIYLTSFSQCGYVDRIS
jgi:hypothetical protein